MPRYVILLHETPEGSPRPTHWDLMLETDGGLATWALAEEPRPGKTIAAEKLADHRAAYLDYEGPVSGGRGSVSRWDAGEYSASSTSPQEWVLRLAGDLQSGNLVLERDDADESRWKATFSAVP